MTTPRRHKSHKSEKRQKLKQLTHQIINTVKKHYKRIKQISKFIFKNGRLRLKVKYNFCKKTKGFHKKIIQESYWVFIIVSDNSKNKMKLRKIKFLIYYSKCMLYIFYHNIPKIIHCVTDPDAQFEPHLCHNFEQLCSKLLALLCKIIMLLVFLYFLWLHSDRKLITFN